MFMNEQKIKNLIRLVEESEIESLEISSWGRKIRITHGIARANGSAGVAPVVQMAAPAMAPVQAAPAYGAPPSAPAPVAEDTSGLVEVKSPMVGTFYSSPSPESDAYVSLNEKITAGQVVCIVEAMKLMNEIEAEVSGRVTQIMIENAQPVEFGQVLFLIDPKG
jgi:acetyl-CoA carboxylase biotin carboxyl carrier protein